MGLNSWLQLYVLICALERECSCRNKMNLTDPMNPDKQSISGTVNTMEQFIGMVNYKYRRILYHYFQLI